MTVSKLKGLICKIIISILMISLLFSQSLVNFQPIQNSTGQTPDVYFYEGFEDLSSSDLLSENFDIEVTGEVPYGITSESTHTDSNSLFVGPSTCGSFCFDDFSVMTTITSLNIVSSEYVISYWRRESYDFGGAIIVFIDGLEVYNEDGDDGVWNTGEDTGWYQRYFIHNGMINSLTFWETDLTDSNTIFLDDIIIQDSSDFIPPTITEIDQTTEQLPGTTSVEEYTIFEEPSIDLVFPQNGLVLGLIATIVISIIVVKVKTRGSQLRDPRNLPPQMDMQSLEKIANAKILYCSTCGDKIDYVEPFCGNCGSKW